MVDPSLELLRDHEEGDREEWREMLARRRKFRQERTEILRREKQSQDKKFIIHFISLKLITPPFIDLTDHMVLTSLDTLDPRAHVLCFLKFWILLASGLSWISSFQLSRYSFVVVYCVMSVSNHVVWIWNSLIRMVRINPSPFRKHLVLKVEMWVRF